MSVFGIRIVNNSICMAWKKLFMNIYMLLLLFGCCCCFVVVVLLLFCCFVVVVYIYYFYISLYIVYIANPFQKMELEGLFICLFVYLFPSL